MRIITFIMFFFFSYYSAYAEPLALSDLFASPDNDNFQLSPQGTYVSFLQREKGRQSILILSSDDLTVAATMLLEQNQYLIDYNWLNEKSVFLLVRIRGKAFQLIGLKDDSSGKFNFKRVKAEGELVDVLEEQPDTVMYQRANPKRKDVFDLYKIDINDLLLNNFESAQVLAKGDDNLRRFFYDNEFKRIIALETFDADDSINFVYKSLTEAKWHKAITLKREDYYFLPIGFAGKSQLAVITNKDTDKKVLRLFDIASQTLGDVVYQHPLYDLEAAKYTADGKLEWVTYIQHGLVKYHYFDNDSVKESTRIKNAFADREIYVIDRTIDDRLEVLYANGSDEPGRYYLYTPADNKAVLLDVSFKKLEDKKLIRSKPLTVASEDGTRIEAFLTLPQDINRSVLLVMPHGGPINIRDNDSFNPEVQYLASRGFAVLRVNFRGSAGYGKSFMEQGVGQFGQLIERDITAVVNEVNRQYSFKYQCAVGNSYGGYSATMLAMTHPEQYQCVIAGFGIYDLMLLFNTSNFRSGDSYTKHIEQTVGAYSESLINVSPVYLSDKLHAPILLFGGKKDNIADFEHTNRFHYVLQRKQHPVETIFYDNTGHGHRDWWGDRHEAAAKVDYITRILVLPELPAEGWSDNAKRALAEDQIVLADGYSYEKRLTHDHEKALHYYKKAAAFGEERALFNIGAYYHRGEAVSIDPQKAEHFYVKSAEQGYVDAHLRLGKLYLEGVFLPQNFAKAKYHLAEVLRLTEDNAEASLYLGRWYCTAPGTERDFSRCLAYLQDNTAAKRKDDTGLESTFRSVIAATLIEGSRFSDDELQKLKEFVWKTYQLNSHISSFDQLSSGVFDKTAEGYLQVDDMTDVRAESLSNKYFGVSFKVDIDGINHSTHQLALISRWTERDANNNVVYIQYGLLYGSPREQWSSMQPLKQTGSTWSVELFDLNRKLLHKEQFSDTAILKSNIASVTTESL